LLFPKQNDQNYLLVAMVSLFQERKIFQIAMGTIMLDVHLKQYNHLKRLIKHIMPVSLKCFRLKLPLKCIKTLVINDYMV